MEVRRTPLPDKDVHVVPTHENEPEHETSSECWCEPELTEDFTDIGGHRMFVHRRPE